MTGQTPEQILRNSVTIFSFEIVTAILGGFVGRDIPRHYNVWLPEFTFGWCLLGSAASLVIVGALRELISYLCVLLLKRKAV